LIVTADDAAIEISLRMTFVSALPSGLDYSRLDSAVAHDQHIREKHIAKSVSACVQQAARKRCTTGKPA
jgi:hypothetical protein